MSKAKRIKNLLKSWHSCVATMLRITSVSYTEIDDGNKHFIQNNKELEQRRYFFLSHAVQLLFNRNSVYNEIKKPQQL